MFNICRFTCFFDHRNLSERILREKAIFSMTYSISREYELARSAQRLVIKIRGTHNLSNTTRLSKWSIIAEFTMNNCKIDRVDGFTDNRHVTRFNMQFQFYTVNFHAYINHIEKNPLLQKSGDSFAARFK